MHPEQLPQQFAPPSSGSLPNQSNQYRSAESKESFLQSASRARSIKSTITKIITSRDELAAYLKQFDMQLLTSAVEYEQNGDFVASSYILYSKHNNYLEPLRIFLERYPDYQASVDAIVGNLK